MRLVKSLLLVLAAVHPAASRTVHVTLLATTDLPGNLYPYDFYTGKPAPRGWAKVATLVRQARARNPNTLLIDCGGAIQGSLLESVYEHYVRFAKLPLGLPLAGPLEGDSTTRRCASR